MGINSIYFHFILEIKVINIFSMKHSHIFTWQRTKSQVKLLNCLHISAVISGAQKACLTPIFFLMDEHNEMK